MSSNKKRLVLASSSPRRRELLMQEGYEFTVDPPQKDEPTDLEISSPVKYAKWLARFKAAEVAPRYPEDMVLGADTVVACNGRIMGKPTGAEDARKMLSELSSTKHVVITGVAILGPGDAELIEAAETEVTMRPMSVEEIEDYIQSGEWQGKAGAYAIQETADKFIVKLDGSFSNVVGLPMELLEQMLSRIS